MAVISNTTGAYLVELDLTHEELRLDVGLCNDFDPDVYSHSKHTIIGWRLLGDEVEPILAPISLHDLCDYWTVVNADGSVSTKACSYASVAEWQHHTLSRAAYELKRELQEKALRRGGK